MIPFTRYAPDADPTAPGVIGDATNLIPTLRGYVGGHSGVDIGMDALAAAALSSAALSKLDGTSRLIAGTTTKLYEKSEATWADVSRVAAYNAGEVNSWRFAQFGDTSLAINKLDVLQASNSGAFADVAGAPKAAVMCVVSGFVMLANTNDGVNDDQDRWWCSAYLDYTDWTPAISTQCTTGRLVDIPGALTGMKALGYDVVAYKDNSMYLGRYAGPPGVWDFTQIPGEVGCASQDAIADIGGAHLFIGNNDIYLFNGTTPQAIGDGIREWFFNDLDPAYAYRICNTYDRDRSLVYFFYPRLGSGGSFTGCIVYNHKSNKWGVSHRTIERALEFVSGGFTWDSIPAPTWDTWPAVSYGSPFWTASSRQAGYIGTDHKLYALSGASASASLTTGNYGTENYHTLLKRVTLRYLDRPTTATMTNYHQQFLGGAWTEGVTTNENNGRFDVLQSAPWHKVRFDFTGNFEVTAAQADSKTGGVL